MPTLIRIAVRFNGSPAETAAATLTEFLDVQGYAGVKVATAVNGIFVPKRERASTRLHDGDAVEIVSTRQGG